MATGSSPHLAEASPPPEAAQATSIDREVLLRRLSYIMFVRVILFTLLLGGTVAVYLLWGKPDQLGNPNTVVLFIFIAAIYLLNILYAVLLRTSFDAHKMAIAQVAIDLATSAVLVHFTGSAESGFVLFFLLSPIAAALTLSRRAALITALAGALLFAATVLLGYLKVMPGLPGQVQPWEVDPDAPARSLLVNGGAIFAVAALAGYLAEQLRSAATRVRQQQARIDQLAALHEDVVRCLTSGLLTIDSSGRILTVNQAARDMLAVGDVQIAGRMLASVAPQLAAKVTSTADNLIRRAEVTEQYSSDSEPRVYGVSVSPLTDRSNRSIGRVVNFQDLTDLRRMEQSVKRSEQLAALGRVAAGVAHEIRNPLASISGSLELLKSEQSLTGDNRRLMDIALREIERLDGLIRQLLQYARPRVAARPIPIEIGREIGALLEGIGSSSRSQGFPAVKLERTSDDLWINGDRDQLRGVLWNLVRNAWQAGEREHVTVNVQQRDTRHVTIAIADNGVGIAPEEVEHIFEPFYTTKDTGSGLGLAIVHRTLQDHNGSIEVESERGRGTVITLVFPRIRPPTGPNYPAVRQ